MNLFISKIVYCQRSSVERKVTCYQRLSSGFGCKGCEDADESEICKRCISNVEEKLSSEDFS